MSSLPHRPLAGPAYRRLLPVAAMVGAALLTAADLVRRSVFAPKELPAGLMVALLGGPLWRTRATAA